jgi:hypothetical protein
LTDTFFPSSVGYSSSDLDGDVSKILESGKERLVGIFESGSEFRKSGNSSSDHLVGELRGARDDDTTQSGASSQRRPCTRSEERSLPESETGVDKSVVCFRDLVKFSIGVCDRRERGTSSHESTTFSPFINIA